MVIMARDYILFPTKKNYFLIIDYFLDRVSLICYNNNMVVAYTVFCVRTNRTLRGGAFYEEVQHSTSWQQRGRLADEGVPGRCALQRSVA